MSTNFFPLRRGKTPLYEILRRAMRKALAKKRAGAANATDFNEERRRFLKAAAAGTALAGSGLLSGKALAYRGSGATQPDIAIVGAGIGGLHAAWILRKSGITAKIYEASSRSGGRMLTGRDVLGKGVVTEFGGEFIDTAHADMHALAKEFGLSFLDLASKPYSELIGEQFYFGGKTYTEDDLERAIEPFIEAIARDAKIMAGSIRPWETQAAAAFDRISIEQYIDTIGIDGWLRGLFDAAYTTEFGLDIAEQSSLNFLLFIEVGEDNAVNLYGESDERYKIIGGNDTITQELARRMENQIAYHQRLESIRKKGARYTLAFQTGAAAVNEIEADVVILAVPFTMLREVHFDLDMPPAKMDMIRELGYGSNAKVMAGFSSRIWQEKKHSGVVYSDLPFQLAWDSSALQNTTFGAMTSLTGGAQGKETGGGRSEEHAERFVADLEKVIPGIQAAYSGKHARFHWPTNPYVKGSYSCYRTGQWTRFHGKEGEPVGSLYFAGEHCSEAFQGFMNGAAETGRKAAERILAIVGK